MRKASVWAAVLFIFQWTMVASETISREEIASLIVDKFICDGLLKLTAERQAEVLGRCRVVAKTVSEEILPANAQVRSKSHFVAQLNPGKGTYNLLGESNEFLRARLRADCLHVLHLLKYQDLAAVPSDSESEALRKQVEANCAKIQQILEQAFGAEWENRACARFVEARRKRMLAKVQNPYVAEMRRLCSEEELRKAWETVATLAQQQAGDIKGDMESRWRGIDPVAAKASVESAIEGRLMFIAFSAVDLFEAATKDPKLAALDLEAFSPEWIKAAKDVGAWESRIADTLFAEEAKRLESKVKVVDGVPVRVDDPKEKVEILDMSGKKSEASQSAEAAPVPSNILTPRAQPSMSWTPYLVASGALFAFVALFFFYRAQSVR